MKDNVSRIILLYGILVSLLCIWLLNDNQDKEDRLKEEIEIKYDYSMTIDSLELELENLKLK